MTDLPSDAPPMVSLRGVERSYPRPGGGRLVALRVGELQVPRGGSLAVTGRNGTGKTTLLHVISGLLRPDKGTVEVDGQDLGRLQEARLDRFRARRVGYLLQGGQLMECLTAEENVMAPMLFAGKPRSIHRARARELLERFGVAHRARHHPSELSGGERQRVALARALANDPLLLLADEPLAALDPDAAERIAALLEDLRLRDHITLVVVTHHSRLLPAHTRVLSLDTREAP